MALSNIFREPRREITESAVGVGAFLAIVVPIGWLDYSIACVATKPKDFWFVLIFLPLLIVAALLVSGLAIVGFLAGTHALGEGICNTLERSGLHLRPRQRH